MYLLTPGQLPHRCPTYYKSNQYISHTGKPTSLLNFVYLQARNFTLRWKANILKPYQTGKSLLDYGCGTGDFLLTCKNAGWEISGIEPSDAARAKATKLTQIKIEHDLAPLQLQKYDAITLWHVLEHVEDLQQKIQELTSMLNEDGTIFIAVPNYESYDAVTYQQHWAAYDVPRHLSHFTKKNHGTPLKESNP